MISVETLQSRLSYDDSTGHLFWRDGPRKGKRAFTYKSKRGYLVSQFRENGSATTLSAHRAAWAIHYGEYPTGCIDHINGDKTDNHIENLRDVLHVENARNCAISNRNSSGVLGVFIHKQTGKWNAQIRAFGKTISLGLFTEKSDAVIARKAAERVLGYHENHGRGK